MSWLDYTIVGTFLLVMALAGFWITRLIKAPDDMFVAGRKLTPFVMAATITATNLSIYHFISMGGIAYQKGISIIWNNWTGCIMLVVSGIFVIPLMRRLRVRSIPEFLEMRYSRGLRILIGAFWGLRLCIFLGIFLYIATITAMGITGLQNCWLWMGVFSLIAIMYSAIGGAWAVAIMDTVQFAFIIAGALITFPIAIHLAGGMPGLIHWLHTSGKPVHTQVVPTGGEFGWLWILSMVLISTKWATVDQAILQRAFGAKTPRMGAKGMVLSGLITTPLAFLWVLPGLAVARLATAHGLTFSNPDQAIPWFLSSQLPQISRGLLGFALFGLVAAQISTITADINSVATLFTSDVYRKLKKIEPTQSQLLFVARISALICGALMILTALIMMKTGEGAVRANLTIVGLVDLPFFVITIILGLLWRRATWQGALWGFFGGSGIAVLAYLLIVPKSFYRTLYPLFHAISGPLAAHGQGWHAAVSGYAPSVMSIVPFISTGAALIIGVIVSLLTKQDNSETKGIWKHFQAGEDEKGDAFHLIPTSARGMLGVALIVLGMVGFLGGVISASVAFGFATHFAVGGMCAVFAGGLLRVYSE